MTGTTIALLLLFAYTATCHSWLECTDYETSVKKTYEVSKCKGFMRNWHNVKRSEVFGQDHGMNYQPRNGKVCRDGLTGSSYNNKFPMAKYKVGDSVRLLWPAKNHVADECINANIPSKATKLYGTCKYENDWTVSDLLSKASLVKDWGGKGFQNCPFFCDNPDKAICSQTFKVPDLGCDRPTFVWLWAFNSDDDLYTSCFEASVKGGSSGDQGDDNDDKDDDDNDDDDKDDDGSSDDSDNGDNSDDGGGDDDHSEGGCNSCPYNRIYRKCGGVGYNGETCCPAGSSCVKVNRHYHQCK